MPHNEVGHRGEHHAVQRELAVQSGGGRAVAGQAGGTDRPHRPHEGGAPGCKAYGDGARNPQEGGEVQVGRRCLGHPGDVFYTSPDTYYICRKGRASIAGTLQSFAESLRSGQPGGVAHAQFLSPKRRRARLTLSVGTGNGANILMHLSGKEADIYRSQPSKAEGTLHAAHRPLPEGGNQLWISQREQRCGGPAHSRLRTVSHSRQGVGCRDGVHSLHRSRMGWKAPLEYPSFGRRHLSSVRMLAKVEVSRKIF